MKSFEKFSVSCCFVWLFAVNAAVAAAPKTLQSPWDLQPVKTQAGSYECPLPEALPKDIELSDYYSDAKHSVKDPARYAAYEKADAPFHKTDDLTAKAADNFQATGSQGAAECVLKVLALNARAGSMTGHMSSNQAYYVQGWTLGALATSWLKVRSAEPGSAEDRAVVVSWLAQVARFTEDYFGGKAKDHAGPSGGKNNHLYWAGFSVIAAGIAANNQEYFDWGVSTYDVGAAEIQPDGTMPLEMARGQKALHYHLFALEPLIMLAEFGAANGVNLYDRHDHALSRLALRCIGGLLDNRYFTSKAGVEQDTPGKGKLASVNLAWLRPYVRRYPDPDMSKVLQGTATHGEEYLGGLPPN